jgi:deazaflavin-dependent oxidoreductase (nitroreductase family)
MPSLGGMAEEQILDSPTDWVAKHIRQYVESGGTEGTVFYGVAALLLTTRGRKSGAWRRTALYYGRHGDAYVVVASNGGSRTHPAWFLNLVADPDVLVQVGPETFRARARVAGAAEKPPLWTNMVSVFPQYARYQEVTARDIPVVVLEPAPE